jgi:hypothetical protein
MSTTITPTTVSALTRLAGATAVAGAALLFAGTPAHAQVAPDPYTGDLRVITLTQAVPAQDLNLGQVGLGALAGLALASAGAVAVRAGRRTHVAHPA